MSLISTTIPNLIGGVSQQPYPIRMASQCSALENCLPTVVDFLIRRPGTQHRKKIMDGLVGDAAVHIINRDVDEQYVSLIARNELKVFDAWSGEEKAVTLEAGVEEYLSVENPSINAGFLTINDYTFVLNKTKTVALDGETLSEVRQPEALVFIKQASYATDYTITLGDKSYTHTTDKDDKTRSLSSSYIADDLAKKITAEEIFDCEVKKSTLWIRKKDGESFVASVSDSRSNTQMSITTDRVQRFSDLPIVAPNGYTTEITGDQSSSFDNYFVKFETNDGTDYDDGVWVETVKPGITTSFDASTMPHALIREADGTFTLKPLEWGKRSCGDEDSSSSPSFVGRKLSSIFFYANRLGLLANENCIFSEAGSFFNFFPTTVTTMVDSDPIDVAASHTKAADLYHVAPFSEGLVLFSDQTQFILEHDDNMSGKTTNVKPITEFGCSIKAQPVSAGKNIYFAINRGAFAGVREYFVEEDSSLTDAVDITSHVPHYIPAHIHKLVSSTNEDCLLALTTEDRRLVALYKYYWSGKEKLQSSWSKWRFSGEVLSAAFLNSTLLLVMQYDDGVYLEAMNIEPGYTDYGAPFEFKLDRKIDEAGILDYTYDDHETTTTITYPYQLSGEPQLVSRYARGGETAEIPPGIVYETISWEGNTATFRGDLRDVLFVTGIPFTSRYRFSPQIIREDSGNGGKLAVTEGRLQLRNMTLTYDATGYFEVHITPEYRETDVRRFTGRIVGHGGNILGIPVLPSGTYKFPVLSRAEVVEIEIISDSFLPFQFTSAGWEGYYHIRSRRV